MRAIFFFEIRKKSEKWGFGPPKGGSNTFIGVGMNLMKKNTSKHISPAISVLLSQRKQSKPGFVKCSPVGARLPLFDICILIRLKIGEDAQDSLEIDNMKLKRVKIEIGEKIILKSYSITP